MLILTRKLGETIKIGDEISVKIIELGRHFVKIGIEAPRNVKVHREEIYDRIREENILAGKAGDSGLSEAVRLFKARGQAMKKAAQGEPEVDGASDGPVVRKKN